MPEAARAADRASRADRPPLRGTALVAVVLAAELGLLWAANSDAVFAAVLLPVLQATGGRVPATLLLGAMMLAVFFLIAAPLGGVRPAAVGWRWRDVPAGLLALVAGWLLLQSASLGAALLDGTGLAAHRLAVLPWPALAALLGQLLGNALAEETIYRAFLLGQLGAVFAARVRSRAGAWLATVAVAQLLFALSHVPNRLMKGMYGDLAAVAGDQIGLFVGGCLLAACFLVTRNLFVAVAVHALWNEPALLWASPLDRDGAHQGVLGAALLGALLFAGVRRWRRRGAGTRCFPPPRGRP